jgi:hypothetical protein
MTFFERGYLTKEIPLSFGVAKNSRSAPLNFWESPVDLSELEFLATGPERYRYPLASGPEGATLEGRKTAMAGKRAFWTQRKPMPTVLKVTHSFA